MKKLLLITLLLFAGVAWAAEPPAWVAESNGNAQVLLKVMAEFSPESAAELGVDGYDDRIVDLGPKVDERSRAALQAAILELRARRAKTSNAAVLQDLDILIDTAQQRVDSSRPNQHLLQIARAACRGRGG